MNVNSISVNASSRAVITPADPTATGTYNLGLGARNPGITVNQIFTMIATEVDAASVDLIAGVAVVTGGDSAGGNGKDADGQTVALTELGVLHFRNTGTTDILFSLPWIDGYPNVVSGLFIKPGKDFFYNSGGVVADAEMSVVPLQGAEKISFELCVMGKQ